MPLVFIIPILITIYFGSMYKSVVDKEAYGEITEDVADKAKWETIYHWIVVQIALIVQSVGVGIFVREIS